MLLIVIRKQILEYLLSLRFLVGAILCLGMGVGATWVRTHGYATAITDYRMNRSDHTTEAASYVHPYPLTYSGLSVDRPPNLLSIFYRGLEPSRPMSFRMTGNRDPMTEDQYERVNLISDLFQTVDMISFTAIVMSLLALVFSYDIISGEKEGGTLRLALSFPVPRDLLLMGKWIGGYLVLVLPFLLTASCSLGVVVLHPRAEVSGSDLAAFCLLVFTSLLYIGVFYSLGLLVSASTSRAFTSMTVLVALWVGLSVGLPNLSPYVTHALVQVPTIQEIERRKGAVTHEENQLRGQRISAYRKTTSDSRVQQRVVVSELYRDCFLQIARRQEQIQADYERAVGGQISAAVWLSRLSPTASLVYSAGEITNTGIWAWRRFRKALQEYRVRFLNYAEDKWIEQAKLGFGDISTRDYPRFFSLTPELSERVRVALADIGLLVVWNLIFFVTGYVAFLRYDVR